MIILLRLRLLVYCCILPFACGVMAYDDWTNESLSEVMLSPGRLTVLVDEKSHFNISVSRDVSSEVTLNLIRHPKGVARILHMQDNVTLGGIWGSSSEVYFKVKRAIAKLIIFAGCDDNETDCSEVSVSAKSFVRVDVVHSKPLVVVIAVVGWIYFVAWTISFYPQIWLNYKRKSVVGLDFNFLALNTLGFACYSVFNCAYRWSPDVQVEFFKKDPFGVNPVQYNDVAFALHAFLACLINVVQCFIYDRGNQRISRTCLAILGILGFFVAISLILGIVSKITWLTFVQYLSYVKLAVTLIKYVPQAYYNMRRKSTQGWSIENVLLDFTGGSFSLIQMFLISYNSDDWSSLFTDFTKFGLGVFSIAFDLLFMTQHYILYPHRVPYDMQDDEPVAPPHSPLDHDGPDEVYVSM